MTFGDGVVLEDFSLPRRVRWKELVDDGLDGVDPDLVAGEAGV